MTTISLCMICGNEEHIIESCLQSSVNVFDELCLVRAIGTQAPDRTAEIAAEFCEKHDKVFWFKEYENKWPGLDHVDDFAAARQMSFDLSDSTWCLWLDCDDYLTEENVQSIRRLSQDVSHDSYLFSYLIAGQGGDILRERLIKRGKGRWINPVHENCIIHGDMVERPDIEVYHKHIPEKRGSSSKRNAEILKRSLLQARHQYMHYHSDMMRLGDTKAAYEAGIVALSVLPVDQFPDQAYLLHLNLSELDNVNGGNHLLKAIEINPRRREAWAFMSERMLKLGRPNDAMFYWQCMQNIPMPEKLPFSFLPHYHGWANHYLHVRILRSLGLTEDSTKIHLECLKDDIYRKFVSQWEKVDCED